MIISIPYSYINGIPVGDCGVQNLTIDLTGYPLCTDKYFELRIVSISTVDGQTITTFNYQQNTYGTTTLSPTELILLLSTAFICPPSYGCLGQEASFDWELTPIQADKWISDSIVNAVSPSNVVYSFSDITVNGIAYTPLPHVFWTDAVDGNASSHVFDYIEEIIAYIVSLNIPEYVGAINYASNGMSDNLDGTGLLELYFETGTTVSIDITAPSPVIAGTFTGGTATTVMLSLEITDTSTMATGDILTQTNYQVTDGVNLIGSTTTPVATVLPYNIFCGGCGLNKNQSWVITETIVTQNVCARNNVATGYIESDEIIDAINNVITKTGSSIG